MRALNIGFLVGLLVRSLVVAFVQLWLLLPESRHRACEAASPEPFAHS